MTYVALVFALLAALLHVLIFTFESVTWMQPKTWRRFGVASQENAEIIKPMAFNQGFYNLFLAIGAALGVILVFTGPTSVGWTLIIFCCGSMVAAALVLVSTGRHYLRAALTQATMPALALLAAGISTLI